MDQQVGLCLARGAERQFLVGAVQWVARLKSHDLAPAHLAEIGAQLIWRVTAAAEVVVHRLLDAGDGPAQIDFARLVVQIVHGWVRAVVVAKHHLGFVCFVWFPPVGNGHGCKDHTFLITQGDILTDLQCFGELLIYVQRDRNGPQVAIGGAHSVDDAIIISLSEKALEWAEAAVHQQFQIANLAWCEIPAGQVCGFGLELLCAIVRHV